jgi:hypothetical protein
VQAQKKHRGGHKNGCSAAADNTVRSCAHALAPNDASRHGVGNNDLPHLRQLPKVLPDSGLCHLQHELLWRHTSVRQCMQQLHSLAASPKSAAQRASEATPVPPRTPSPLLTPLSVQLALLHKEQNPDNPPAAIGLDPQLGSNSFSSFLTALVGEGDALGTDGELIEVDEELWEGLDVLDDVDVWVRPSVFDGAELDMS